MSDPFWPIHNDLICQDCSNFQTILHYMRSSCRLHQAETLKEDNINKVTNFICLIYIVPKLYQELQLNLLLLWRNKEHLQMCSDSAAVLRSYVCMDQSSKKKIALPHLFFIFTYFRYSVYVQMFLKLFCFGNSCCYFFIWLPERTVKQLGLLMKIQQRRACFWLLAQSNSVKL